MEGRNHFLQNVEGSVCHRKQLPVKKTGVSADCWLWGRKVGAGWRGMFKTNEGSEVSEKHFFKNEIFYKYIQNCPMPMHAKPTQKIIDLQ